MGHPAGRDSVYRGCRVVKFRLASRDSVHRNWPFPFAIVFRAGVTTLTFLLLYNSPVRNCARALPKLQSASVLVTIETMTSLASIPQESFNSRQSSA